MRLRRTGAVRGRTAPDGGAEAAGAGVPTAPAEVLRWRVATMTAFALGGITLASWGPRLLDVRTDLDVGDAGIGLVLGGVTVGSISGLLAATPVLARLGGRGTIRSALLVVAAGLVLVGLGAGALGSVPAAAAGFAVIGLGIGVLDVAINVEGSAVERAAGRTLMPLMHAAWSAGVVVGAGVGALAVGADVAYPVQFCAEAALIAALAVSAIRWIPARSGPAPVQAPVRERIALWASGWRDARLLLIGLVMLGVELGEGSANNWLTLAVQTGHDEPARSAALYFVAFAAGETTARVLGGPLVDRLGRVRTIRVTTAVGAVGLALFILGGSPPLILAGAVLWSVGVSMGFPLGMSAAAESGPDPAARVSVVASIGYLANLAGPPAIGLLSESVGLLGALWSVVALLVVGFVAAGALGARRQAGTVTVSGRS